MLYTNILWIRSYQVQIMCSLLHCHCAVILSQLMINIPLNWICHCHGYHTLHIIIIVLYHGFLDNNMGSSFCQLGCWNSPFEFLYLLLQITFLPALGDLHYDIILTLRQFGRHCFFQCKLGSFYRILAKLAYDNCPVVFASPTFPFVVLT